MKRMTIRLVDELNTVILKIAKKRGISVNALIAEMAWEFVEEWREKHQKER